VDTTLSDPLVGRVVDERYRVVARLARGGMATVYEAVDLRLERTVALKVMHPSLADDAEFVARFVREARSAARLSNPHVVAVYDQGQDDEIVFLVMEYVPSLNLREVLRDRGRLTTQEAFDVLEPLLVAMTAAHQAGIVHRDIKPENVLLAQDGRILVADFGLARATSTVTSATQGVLIGTVAYLAPEQVARGVADPRSDVYAAGIVLYEMLTGAPPFAGENAMSVAYQHVNDVVPAPSTAVTGVPAVVDALVAGATAKDPDDRYSDASRFLEALRATRDRIGLDPWAAPVASSAYSLSDTLIVPRSAPVPADQPVAVPLASTATATIERAPEATDAPVAGPTDRTAVKERRKRRRRGALALIVVLALAAAIGLFAYEAGATRYVDTPAVATLAEDEALAEITALGLTPVLADREFSETVARDTVIRTDPAGGERVEEGGEVSVIVSKGPERFDVPKVKDLTEAQAIKALKDENLAPGQIDKAYSDTVPEGKVISSKPEAGKPLKRGAGVDLVVSRGPKPVKVPRVVGQSRASALAELRGVGLVPRIESEQFSETVASGVVISQKPGRTKTVDSGSDVFLVLSKGPPPVTVPNVVGMRLSNAERELEAAGLKVASNSLLPGIALGIVRSQSSPEGSQVPKGSTITLSYV
jgi:serine/threonine-protein kinase